MDPLGYPAASLTTLSVMPQAEMTLRSGDTAAISRRVYLMFTSGEVWSGPQSAQATAHRAKPLRATGPMHDRQPRHGLVEARGQLGGGVAVMPVNSTTNSSPP